MNLETLILSAVSEATTEALKVAREELERPEANMKISRAPDYKTPFKKRLLDKKDVE